MIPRDFKIVDGWGRRFDRAGRRNVICGDRVAEFPSGPRADNIVDLARGHQQILEKWAVRNVIALLIPLVNVAPLSGFSFPWDFDRQNRDKVSERFRLERGLHRMPDFMRFGQRSRRKVSFPAYTSRAVRVKDRCLLDQPSANATTSGGDTENSL